MVQVVIALICRAVATQAMMTNTLPLNSASDGNMIVKCCPQIFAGQDDNHLPDLPCR